MPENKFENQDTPADTQRLPTTEASQTRSFEAPPASPSVGGTNETTPSRASSISETHEEKPDLLQLSEPAFRPENESGSPETGFVGYITARRAPQDTSSPEPPHPSVPGEPAVRPALQPPTGHPGIRTSTVVTGLILLAVGITALTAHLGGVTLNPAAVALAVMLGAGLTLISAALRRTRRRS